MVNVNLKARKWGNSLGLVIPANISERMNIKENDEVEVIFIKKGNVLKETFGMLKGKIKEDSQAMKDRLRKEMYNDY